MPTPVTRTSPAARPVRRPVAVDRDGDGVPDRYDAAPTNARNRGWNQRASEEYAKFVQTQIRELMRRGVRRSAVTVVTQVEVDPADPAFAAPTKPIGSFMDQATATALAAREGWTVAEDAGRGWRRVVPSPRPKVILELDAIRDLVRLGYVVVGVGGGGIPVARGADGTLHGLEAVIDKDYASALLAVGLGADRVGDAQRAIALQAEEPPHRDGNEEHREKAGDGGRGEGEDGGPADAQRGEARDAEEGEARREGAHAQEIEPCLGRLLVLTELAVVGARDVRTERRVAGVDVAYVVAPANAEEAEDELEDENPAAQHRAHREEAAHGSERGNGAGESERIERRSNVALRAEGHQRPLGHVAHRWPRQQRRPPLLADETPARNCAILVGCARTVPAVLRRALAHHPTLLEVAGRGAIDIDRNTPLPRIGENILTKQRQLEATRLAGDWGILPIAGTIVPS